MRHPDSLREAARLAYGAGASYARISRRFRIAPDTVRTWAVTLGWTRDTGEAAGSGPPRRRDGRGRFHEGPPGTGSGGDAASRPPRHRRRPVTAARDTAVMLEGFRRVVGRAVAEAEERWSAPGTPPPAHDDLRDLAALGGLLARLVALDRTGSSARDRDDAPEPGIDLDDPRQREALVARLERLVAGAESGGPGLADGG
jgi:hypothetical protein